MEGLLNLEKGFSVPLLEQTVATFYNPAHPEHLRAKEVLKRLSEDPNAWQKAPEVVEAATNDSSRFFALKLLEDCIKTRWNALPPDQRLAVKEYVVQRILQLSKDDASMSAHRVVVGKLNQLLVEILKHEWPHNWPTFITELTGSSKASQTMCENNMQILKLMSEEIFEFAEEAMTSKKTATLKESMHGEFAKVFELCTFILQNAKKDSLIDVTLQCLQRFICWVARGFIFETKLIEVLIQKFLPSGSTSIGVNTIGCLIEIVTLDNVAPAYHARVQLLFGSFMQKLVELLPPSTDMPSAYARGSTIQQFFVQKVGLFLTSTFKRHLALLEGPLREQVLVGMNYLVSISMVAEMEIFKDCIEFWNIFSWNLKQESDASLGMVGAVGGGGFGGGAAGAAAPFGAAPATDAWGKLTTGLAAQSRPVPASKGAASRNPRVQMYNARVLAAVRMVMVTKMARPEEVLIEEDDSGMIVRTTQRDTDAIELYKVMRETIVFLTHLDVENMEFIMMDKLSKQVNGAEWSWKGLNRLCWAIGSISQTMPEDDEKRFLVMVIKDLLQLCEAKHGKYNKAVVASCIMYVTSQYPRFLKAHWKFLKTVVNKLFEFMHELHPGVQDMACDTFIKISKKCKSKFLHLQELEDMPFVDRLLIDLPTTIRDLKAHQVQTFYEAVGHMISAEKSHPARRNDLLLRLMHLPHTEWERAMANASQSLMSLCEPETVKTITRTVRTMVQVCRAVGHPFIDYLQRVYGNMMQVYKVYSEFVSTRFAEMGPIAAQADPLVRVIRQAKKECLLLIEAFIEKSDPAQMDEEGHPIVAHHLIPPLLEPSSVLGDYHRSHPGARDAEVLSLMSTFISKLRGQVGPLIPRVVEGVFEQTLGMIQQNFTDYPEIRRELFRLIAQITKHCFEQIFEIAAHHQRAVVECIMWAIKHHERSVSEMGLDTLSVFLRKVGEVPALKAGFYMTFYVSIVQDILGVLTDRMHKSGFELQAALLRGLIELVETNQLSTPVWSNLSPELQSVVGTVPPDTTNQLFVRQFITSWLMGNFSTLATGQVQSFVATLCDMRQMHDVRAFQTHLRDFLISMKEFAAEGSNADLYAAQSMEAKRAHEAQVRVVAGVLNPYDVDEDDDDL